MKICNFIAASFYLASQNFFIVDGLAIKLFFNTITDFIPNITVFF